MASPQLKDGYTKIANDIVEALARIRIPGEARQVLDVIIRQTYGWNKKEAQISLAEFCDSTGIDKPEICRGLRRLEEMNLIIIGKNANALKIETIGKNANAKTITYGLQKDFDKWQPLAKMPMLAKLPTQPLAKMPMPINEPSPLLPPFLVLKKKERKKCPTSFSTNTEAYKLSECLFNLILKNNSHSRLHACQNGDKEKTIQRWAQDIDKLIHIDHQKPSTVEEVIRFATRDNFWGANILSGSKLREKWDTLVGQKQRQGVGIAGKSASAAGDEDDVILDPATGNPSKTIPVTSTRKSVQQKFREGLL